MAKQGAAAAIEATNRRDSAADTISRERSDDLVVALVGHIGTDLERVRRILQQEFNESGYESRPVKVSELIKELALHSAVSKPEEFSTSSRRFDQLVSKQTAGTKLRQSAGEDITASLAVRAIRQARAALSASSKRVFLIDSLKHHREVELLRRVYGNSFYLVSVLCRRETRVKFVRDLYCDERVTDDEIEALLKRDEADTEELGQQVRKTLHLGDYFIDIEQRSAEDETIDPIADSLGRFVDAVLERKIVRPTRDERGMHAAWSASLRSACLSRQVGAAILDQQGLVLATGTNDVPRAGGGLYDEETGSSDHRCFNLDEKYCRNDRTKQAIYQEIFEQLQSRQLLAENVTAEQIRKCIEATPVRDLVEFSRAVHAEMDVVLSLARGVGAGTQGALLYCTTYPCHSCARHIVAAGITEVVYIEPYTKSRAVLLHGDAIIETTSYGATKLAPKDQRVRFRLFSGVAPRRFSSLFEKRGELKDKKGDLVSLRTKMQPRDEILLKSFVQLEDIIATLAEDAFGSAPKGEGA